MGWGKKFSRVFQSKNGNWLTNLAESVDSSYTDATGGKKWAKLAYIGLTGNAPAGIYSYSKDKGMSSDEAAQNGATFGANYSTVRMGQIERIKQEEQDARDLILTKQQAADAQKARGQAEVRVRRRGSIDSPGNKGGTLLTGALGVPGSAGGGTSFSSLLGL